MSESTVDIATPGLDDLDALVALWGELVSDQRTFGTRLLVRENEASARSWLATQMTFDGVRVARVDDELVGFVTFEPMLDQFTRAGQDGVVHNLYVTEGYRDTGIGSALLERAEQLLADRGADRVRLEVLTANERAQEFYLERGYAPFRTTFGKELEDT